MQNYDVIVIGSGIGGLVSAGILACKGMKPLVIEKHSAPGGYLTSFSRKGFIFDSAVDCISGAAPGGLIDNILRMLGVEDEVKFLRVDPIRVSRFPDFDIAVEADIKAYQENLQKLFSSESAGIESFFKKTGETYSRLDSALQAILSGKFELNMLTPEVLRFMEISYVDLLDEYFSDNKLIAVLSDRCPFIGLPPANVSAATMINLMMSYFGLGAFRPEGGFQRLSDALVKGIEKRVGKIIFGNAATKIILDENNRCKSVRCNNGEEYSARHIISNADFNFTFGTLLGGKYRQLAEDMIRRPGVSTSFYIVYAGIEGKLNAHSSIGYFPSYAMSKFFDPGMEFREDSTIGVTIASREDSSRAPKGCDTVVFHEMIEASNKKLDKSFCTEKILMKAEKIFPGVREKIIVLETATPATLQKYTGNHNGAAFGWKQIPGFRGPKRHGISNLHIVGHWGDLGGGVLAAAYSGAKAAAEILAKEGIKDVI